ncbi:MAG TPA: hypothetical protein VFG58_09450 [Solirubrobacterales bacterium]|nr:hypothetical protein [Solirubrobacterales bacterium]
MDEMRALWHPIRARILEIIKSDPGPTTRSRLMVEAGAPFAEVAYHCRALQRSGCIKPVDSPGDDADDPTYEAP